VLAIPQVDLSNRTEVKQEIRKIETSQAQYHQEEKQMEAQRNKQLVVAQAAGAQAADEVTAEAIHQCTAADAAPNVSVAVFNDKMWSPSEGCECLEHPFCSRKALLVRGVSQKWPQRSQVTFGNGQLNGGRTDASEHYSTGGYMWCFTKRSATCGKCWNWCKKEDLAVTAIALTAKKIDSGKMTKKMLEARATYANEKKEIEEERGQELVVRQAKEEAATPFHQCTAADAAPNVSVSVISDKRWSPPGGCECLEHPFCSRKALLVRGVTPSWPQKQGTQKQHMWCYTKRSSSCSQCWAFCYKTSSKHEYDPDAKKQILPPVSGEHQDWSPDAWPNTVDTT
jgi:hypothetical protein